MKGPLLASAMSMGAISIVDLFGGDLGQNHIPLLLAPAGRAVSKFFAA